MPKSAARLFRVELKEKHTTPFPATTAVAFLVV